MRNEGSIRVQRGSLQIQHSSGLERSEQPQRFLNTTRRDEERNVRPTFSLLSCLQSLLMLEGLQFRVDPRMERNALFRLHTCFRFSAPKSIQTAASPV